MAASAASGACIPSSASWALPRPLGVAGGDLASLAQSPALLGLHRAVNMTAPESGLRVAPFQMPAPRLAASHSQREVKPGYPVLVSRGSEPVASLSASLGEKDAGIQEPSETCVQAIRKLTDEVKNWKLDPWGLCWE